MSLLTVRGLSAGYGAAPVIEDIDLDVRAGEITVILGANGAGKTTTMRALSGEIKVSGSIEFDGTQIANLRPDQIARRGMRVVPQGRGTLTSLSVRDNLRVGASARTDGDIERDITSWTDRFPALGRRIDQPAGNLSGGEQQMLALARALISRPQLLLCDEPSLGLAPVIVRELFAFLREIQESLGTAMLLVEQNANLALNLATDVYLLEVGRTVAQGSADDFINNDAIRRAYLGM